MMKKLLSIILSMLIIFSCVMPFAALAAEPEQDTQITTDPTADTEEEEDALGGIFAKIIDAIVSFVKKLTDFFSSIDNLLGGKEQHNFVRGLDEEYHWQVCQDCGEIQYKVTHIFSPAVITTPPTCAAEGVLTHTCAVCDYSWTESIAALSHSEVVLPAVEPTETETGLTAGRMCTVCGQITLEQEVIPALG